MIELKDWTTTGDGMNAFTPPDAAQEDGTTVAQLNDCQRESQATVRRYYNTMEWRDFGYTISSTGSDTVTFSEAIPLYVAGQRVKLTDTPAGILYGTITSNIAQVLTIAVDGGTSLTTVSVVEAGFSPVGDPAGIADAIASSSSIVFNGTVLTNGTVEGNTGWTAVWDNPTGECTVTHTLNTQDIAVVATCLGASIDFGYVTNVHISNNSNFRVYTKFINHTNNELTISQINFAFHVVRY